MLGYDWARLHAALNDLPAALLLFAVLFDALGAVTRRDSLKAAGFWCLLAGVAGTLLAIGAGLMAEDRVEHSERAHDLMETHETLAFVVLGIFGVLALWRLVRRVLSRKEETVYLTVGIVGVAILVATAKIGGNLVFDHGLGLSGHTLQSVVEERRGGHQHEAEEREGAAPAAGATPPAPASADTAHH